MDNKKPLNRYSTAFKLRVVDEVENGLLLAVEARKLYGIGCKPCSKKILLKTWGMLAQDSA